MMGAGIIGAYNVKCYKLGSRQVYLRPEKCHEIEAVDSPVPPASLACESPYQTSKRHAVG